MHQFKEKSEQQRELVSAGLFFYPVLMAADVLAYRATTVPVGDDQRQHIELMRDIAERFDARFGDVLVVPNGRYPEVGARIMNLQEPTSRMSTTYGSEQGIVYILDEPDAVRKKVRSAVTDSGTEVRRAPDKAGITNLIEILSVIRDVAPEEIEREFEGSGYGDFKGAVADAVVDYLASVRERYTELRPDEAAIEQKLAAGAEKARAIASETLTDVRDAMGIGPARA
jgi:tryptophanyl-tRNA synthetase